MSSSATDIPADRFIPGAVDLQIHGAAIQQPGQTIAAGQFGKFAIGCFSRFSRLFKVGNIDTETNDMAGPGLAVDDLQPVAVFGTYFEIGLAAAMQFDTLPDPHLLATMRLRVKPILAEGTNDLLESISRHHHIGHLRE